MADLSEQIDAGVGLLTFNRAAVNNEATAEMWLALAEALGRFARMDQVSVVVLTGAGHRAFVGDARAPADDALASLAEFPKPLIARLRGDCFGVGLEVALRCDIRIAATDSDSALPNARAYGLATQGLLARTIGASRAKLLLMTGQQIGAAEALRIGLVDRVVDDADLSDEVVDIARTIADGASVDMQAIKRVIDAAAEKQQS